MNKTSSRVEVVWNVTTSSVLNDAQRARLMTRLASKLSQDGELRVVASDTRSQAQNRDIAEERLGAMVHEALKVPKVRKPTKPSKAAKQARLESKRRQTEKKRERRWRGDEA